MTLQIRKFGAARWYPRKAALRACAVSMSCNAAPASCGDSVIGHLFSLFHRVLCPCAKSRTKGTAAAKNRSVGEAARCREGVEPVVAQHMRGEMARSEHRREGVVADVEPARIGPECRHHQDF